MLPGERLYLALVPSLLPSPRSISGSGFWFCFFLKAMDVPAWKSRGSKYCEATSRRAQTQPSHNESSQHHAISPATVWALCHFKHCRLWDFHRGRVQETSAQLKILFFTAPAAFFKTKRSTRAVHPPMATSCPPRCSREPCDVTDGQLAAPPPAAPLHLLHLQAWGLGQDQR